MTTPPGLGFFWVRMSETHGLLKKKLNVQGLSVCVLFLLYFYQIGLHVSG